MEKKVHVYFFYSKYCAFIFVIFCAFEWYDHKSKKILKNQYGVIKNARIFEFFFFFCCFLKFRVLHGDSGYFLNLGFLSFFLKSSFFVFIEDRRSYVYLWKFGNCDLVLFTREIPRTASIRIPDPPSRLRDSHVHKGCLTVTGGGGIGGFSCTKNKKGTINIAHR